jgi:hypothetical protein
MIQVCSYNILHAFKTLHSRKQRQINKKICATQQAHEKLFSVKKNCNIPRYTHTHRYINQMESSNSSFFSGTKIYKSRSIHLYIRIFFFLYKTKAKPEHVYVEI